MNRIGGVLDMRALALLSGRPTYGERANIHRQTDSAQLAAEVRRLHAAGLLPLDISTALHITPDAVANLLTNHPCE